VAAAAPAGLTTGDGIEWRPVVTGDGKSVAHLASDARRPPLPAVVSLTGGPAATLAEDRLPAGYPSAAFVTPEPVVIRSADGLLVHAQLFKAPGATRSGPPSSTSTAARRVRCCWAGTTWATTRTTTRPTSTSR